MKKRILLYFFLTLLSSNVLFSQSILSMTRTWDGDAMDGEWITITNWDNNLLPEFDADVIIDNTESVNLASPHDITVESLTFGQSGSTTKSGDLTIADGASLTLTKGGADGSNSLRLDGIAGNTSILTVNGTLNVESDASGHGIDHNNLCEIIVGSNGELNISAKGGSSSDGISLADDITNSGTLEISANSTCRDGVRSSGIPSGGSVVITNNVGAEIIISGGMFMTHGFENGSNVTLNNDGTVTISGTLSTLLTGSINFNNYGTFAGDGIVDAKNFKCLGSSPTISPGIPTVPIGKLEFLDDMDFSGIDLDMQINGASSFDQLEMDSNSDLDISGATLNLTGTYTPTIGEVFTIINVTTGSLSGKFSNLPIDGSTIDLNGVPMEIAYTASSATLTAIAPLPVELISFNGHAMDRTNMLKWQTASEENTMTFIIERSVDGAYDFEEIDRINAVGNSTVLRSYSIEDLNPVTLAYYRLRIVDFDGYFEYSDIIAIERNKTKLDLIEVYPVPAEEEVTVVIHAQTNGKAILTLSDFIGRKIKEEKIDLKSGMNQYKLNWQEHESNFYYLTIYNSNERIVKKILRTIKD